MAVFMQRIKYVGAFSLIIAALFYAASSQGAAKEKSTPSLLSGGMIMDFIEEQREIQQTGLIDVVERFKKESSVLDKRFGNYLNVLNLEDVSFSGEEIDSVSFKLARMVGANLQDAKAMRSDFVGVNFRGANLRGANFSYANLSRADFTNTDIGGTIFHGANIYKANFNKAKGVSQDELRRLKNLANSFRTLKRKQIKGQYD